MNTPKKTEYNKKYRQEHREEHKEYMKEYVARPEVKQKRKEYTHSEKKKKQDKKYRQEHKEEIKKYQHEHKEEIKEYQKEYNQRPEIKERRKEYHKEYHKEYFKTPKGRLILAKHESKRRNYGDTILMNNPFHNIDYEWHHLKNRLFIWPMPKITHRYVGGKKSNDGHWTYICMWIKKLFCIDIEKLLKDGLS